MPNLIDVYDRLIYAGGADKSAGSAGGHPAGGIATRRVRSIFGSPQLASSNRGGSSLE